VSDRIVHVLCDPKDAPEVSRRLEKSYRAPRLNSQVWFEVAADSCAGIQDETAILRRVRERTLRNSTVTVVTIGRCTHSLQSIDWVIKASLFHERGQAPNGVLVVCLPDASSYEYLSPRLQANVRRKAEGYAPWYKWPEQWDQLIEEAFVARVGRLAAIKNDEPLMRTNATCRSCGVVHDR
jgi:hypothetical protein